MKRELPHTGDHFTSQGVWKVEPIPKEPFFSLLFFILLVVVVIVVCVSLFFNIEGKLESLETKIENRPTRNVLTKFLEKLRDFVLSLEVQ